MIFIRYRSYQFDFRRWHTKYAGTEERTRTSDIQFPFVVAVHVLLQDIFISVALPTELLPYVYYILSVTADKINQTLKKTAFGSYGIEP